MIYSYITTISPTQVYTGYVKRAIIQVNGAFTGTIKVFDGTGNTASSTPNVATITNPTVGSRYEYFGLQNGFQVIGSTGTSLDITASADLSRSGI